MARRHHVHVKSRIAAPREEVWGRYVDHAGMTSWAGLGRVSVERDGVPAPDGVGCIRVFHTPGFPCREENLSFEPPTRKTYRVVSGVPLRDHAGEVVFEDAGDGTRVVWSCSFAPQLPGTGTLLRLAITQIFARTLRRLNRRLRRDRHDAVEAR